MENNTVVMSQKRHVNTIVGIINIKAGKAFVMAIRA